MQFDPLKRRDFIALLGGAAIAAAVTCAVAQTSPETQYPSQRVTIVVPFSAGSISDGLARVLAARLTDVWRQPVIVENRPGIAGTASVAKALPDGLTLMLTSNGHTIAAMVAKNLPFDPSKDFAGVTQVASVPQALMIPPDLPAKDLNEWIALVRAKPGQMNFASAGLASTSYLGAELLKHTAKLDIVHVPHKGAPEASTSVMRNESQLFFLGVNHAVELHKAGKVRVIAVASPKRSQTMPEIPTVSESGLPDYKYDAWFAMLAPAKTPKPILNKVNADIARILQEAEVAERLTRQGVDLVVNTQDVFDAILKQDVERNSAILRATGVVPN